MMIPSVPEEPSAPEPLYERAKSPIADARTVGSVEAPVRLSGVMMSGSVTSSVHAATDSAAVASASAKSRPPRPSVFTTPSLVMVVGPRLRRTR